MVTDDVPPDERTSTKELAREVHLVRTLDLVLRISVGNGAALVGLDRWPFAEVMKSHGVPTLGYSASDLDREVASADRGWSSAMWAR